MLEPNNDWLTHQRDRLYHHPDGFLHRRSVSPGRQARSLQRCHVRQAIFLEGALVHSSAVRSLSSSLSFSPSLFGGEHSKADKRDPTALQEDQGATVVVEEASRSLCWQSSADWHPTSCVFDS